MANKCILYISYEYAQCVKTYLFPMHEMRRRRRYARISAYICRVIGISLSVLLCTKFSARFRFMILGPDARE